MDKLVENLSNSMSNCVLDNKQLICIDEYKNNKKLVEICKSFEGQHISMNAMFMGKSIQIYNCNAVGIILEDIFYPIIKQELNDFEEGPKQASPDYYGMNKKYEFEQKVFTNSPGFDIGNFTSYVNQLSENDGLYRKLFNTKYLVFEYNIDDKKIKINKFHYLNVYNIVSYTSKYPLSMQVKKNVWYNIRPDSVKNWYSTTKTPHLFVDNIIKCINECPHIECKADKIDSITKQFNSLKLKYTF